MEMDTATDCHVSEAIEQMHVGLMVAQQPERPRVIFLRQPPRAVDLDDEITNVMQRFG